MATDKVLPPARFVHLVLKSPNFKSMVAFYKAMLGAHASFEDENLAFLTYDEEHHRVAIVNFPHASVADNPMLQAGMDHMAFTYDSLADLATSYKQRKARGILPVWCINHGPTMSMYYQDPDGNKIEIQVDLMSVDEATAFMTSPEFAENPIGVDFDPEDLVRRIEAGEDEAEIRKRPNIGKRGLETVPMPPKPVPRESYEPVETVVA